MDSPSPQRFHRTARLPPAATQGRRRWHASQLAAFEQLRTEIDADPSSRDADDPLWGNRAALEAGLLARRAGVQWCDWVLARLGDQRG